jgi:aminoglycoside phosphotransferase family enzyme
LPCVRGKVFVPAEPVIVMRRYPDSRCLATLVKMVEPVEDHVRSIADTLARFHGDAARGRDIDAWAAIVVTAQEQQAADERAQHRFASVQSTIRHPKSE